jgi:hypothetical protein
MFVYPFHARAPKVRMSIPEKKDRDATDPESTKYPGGYVVPEQLIRDFVAEQRVRDLDTLEARMWEVQEAAQALLKGRSTKAHLARIKRVSRQSQDPLFKQIMSAILAAVEDGEEGFWAVSTTAVRIVELMGR